MVLGREGQVPVSHAIPRANNTHTHFLSIVVNKLHEILNTSLYNRICVRKLNYRLTLSVLSMSETGWAIQGACQAVHVVKNPAASAGDARDMGWVPGSGRSPGADSVTPLQYSYLETPWAEPGGLQSMEPQSQRWLNDEMHMLRAHTHRYTHRLSCDVC